MLSLYALTRSYDALTMQFHSRTHRSLDALTMQFHLSIHRSLDTLVLYLSFSLTNGVEGRVGSFEHVDTSGNKDLLFELPGGLLRVFVYQGQG